MEVNIKGNNVQYHSDYPNGWQFSAGDPFKYPVIIGDTACFIKRFEQKTPEDISGWGLLTAISGKEETNLAKIFDVKSTHEDGKEIFYVFYEYLEGKSLDKYLTASDIDL